MPQRGYFSETKSIVFVHNQNGVAVSNSRTGQSDYVVDCETGYFCFDKECDGWTARNIQCVDLCTDTKLSDCMVAWDHRGQTLISTTVDDDPGSALLKITEEK